MGTKHLEVEILCKVTLSMEQMTLRQGKTCFPCIFFFRILYFHASCMYFLCKNAFKYNEIHFQCSVIHAMIAGHLQVSICQSLTLSDP